MKEADRTNSVFQPGDVCDRYRIVRLIATGGMGEVYQATQEFIERDVALKTVRAVLADRDEFHKRLKTEAILLGKIQHPNVVTVYDAGITTNRVMYIAMQLLGGQTLREGLRAVGRIPVPQALQIVSQIADGLEAAHEIGVVHRDVKPENIFITEQNALKILDLGTAKLFQAGLRTSATDRVLGTLWYMAPEQILTESHKVSPRSDIYALGLVLFEMVRGVHAFAGEPGDPLPAKYELGLRQLYQDPTPLTESMTGFPAYVWNLIAKAIAKDPDQRHASMAEFAADARQARRRLVQEVQAAGLVPGYASLARTASAQPHATAVAARAVASGGSSSSTPTHTLRMEPGFSAQPTARAKHLAMPSRALDYPLGPAPDLRDEYESGPRSIRTERVDSPVPSAQSSFSPGVRPVETSARPAANSGIVVGAATPPNPNLAKTQGAVAVIEAKAVEAHARETSEGRFGRYARVEFGEHAVLRQRGPSEAERAEFQHEVWQSYFRGLENLPDIANGARARDAFLEFQEPVADPQDARAAELAIACLPLANEALRPVIVQALLDLIEGRGSEKEAAVWFFFRVIYEHIPDAYDAPNRVGEVLGHPRAETVSADRPTKKRGSNPRVKGPAVESRGSSQLGSNRSETAVAARSNSLLRRAVIAGVVLGLVTAVVLATVVRFRRAPATDENVAAASTDLSSRTQPPVQTATATSPQVAPPSKAQRTVVSPEPPRVVVVAPAQEPVATGGHATARSLSAPSNDLIEDTSHKNALPVTSAGEAPERETAHSAARRRRIPRDGDETRAKPPLERLPASGL